MLYDICRLTFPYGVHFGNRTLDSSAMSFCADTLFSALCIEALKDSEEKLTSFYEMVKCDKLVFSDAFPYIDDSYLLPKPCIAIDANSTDSSVKKKYKKMNYVALSMWQSYMDGDIDLEEELSLERSIGKYMIKTSARVRGEENTLPYCVGTYVFSENAGLYIVLGYDGDSEREFFYDLLDGLSYSGIGGRRSSGLGRFEAKHGKMPNALETALNREADRYMTLSVSLPLESEIEQSVHNASYIMKKRSGFVESTDYADTPMKKKDLYMFAAGSCFTTQFEGDIYDVSSHGRHPVYRYGKPLFMGV